MDHLQSQGPFCPLSWLFISPSYIVSGAVVTVHTIYSSTNSSPHPPAIPCRRYSLPSDLGIVGSRLGCYKAVMMVHHTSHSWIGIGFLVCSKWHRCWLTLLKIWGILNLKEILPPAGTGGFWQAGGRVLKGVRGLRFFSSLFTMLDNQYGFEWYFIIFGRFLGKLGTWMNVILV